MIDYLLYTNDTYEFVTSDFPYTSLAECYADYYNDTIDDLATTNGVAPLTEWQIKTESNPNEPDFTSKKYIIQETIVNLVLCGATTIINLNYIIKKDTIGIEIEFRVMTHLKVIEKYMSYQTVNGLEDIKIQQFKANKSLIEQVRKIEEVQKLGKIDFTSKSIIRNSPALVSPIFNTILNIVTKMSNDIFQRRKDYSSVVTTKKQLLLHNHKPCSVSIWVGNLKNKRIYNLCRHSS